MEKMEASSVVSGDSGDPEDLAADKAYPSKWLWVDRHERVHVLAHLQDLPDDCCITDVVEAMGAAGEDRGLMRLAAEYITPNTVACKAVGPSPVSERCSRAYYCGQFQLPRHWIYNTGSCDSSRGYKCIKDGFFYQTELRQ